MNPIFIMWKSSLLAKDDFPELWGPFKSDEDADKFIIHMKEQGCKGEFATINSTPVYKSDGTLDLDDWT